MLLGSGATGPLVFEKQGLSQGFNRCEWASGPIIVTSSFFFLIPKKPEILFLCETSQFLNVDN